jgi:two-component system response regulator RegX3
MAARILVVEDEPSILSGICDLLAFHGHEAVGVDHGDDGLRQSLDGGYDLVLLDVMLPGIDGFSICRQLRAERPGQAILMLTAKGREEDILEGFEAGCDDYISKPFSVAQLAARVDALLRRVGAGQARSSVTLGDLEVDLDNLRARVGDAQADLSPRDADVLAYLVRERHRAVSREDLLREVWGYPNPQALETRCVDMHIVKLRRKLAAILPGEGPIETVRGVGYRLRDSS